MTDWTEKEIHLEDLGQLYEQFAGEWLLLEILEGNGRTPTLLRLHGHHSDKNKLHDWMAEHDNWDWSRRYVLVEANPKKPCTVQSGAFRAVAERGEEGD
jgi:hypothetical protein